MDKKGLISICISIFTTVVAVIGALFATLCWLRLLLIVSAILSLYVSIESICSSNVMARKIEKNDSIVSGHEDRLSSLEDEHSYVEDETLHVPR